MDDGNRSERFQTVIVGGGQAGLAVGYHLARRGREFVILDAYPRIGDAWRSRWDSLRLFTPARHDALPGWRFPGPGWSFPRKDEMADYLEAYAGRFHLPVRTGVRIDRLGREDGRYVAYAGDRRFEAEHVVLATGTFDKPSVPAFASELNPGIVQLHSSRYRRLSQLRDGDVLIVGAGNSGAEIAVETATRHRTWLSGRDVGHVPFNIEGIPSRLLLERLVLRFLFHRVLTTSTPVGRRVRPRVLSKGWPLIRTRPKVMAAAGIERVPRVIGVEHGLPVLQDGRVLDVSNIVWCTGFRHDFSWIELPGFDGREPAHRRGVITAHPGLYLVGMEFLYSLSSAMVHGADRDAQYIAERIAARAPRRPSGLDPLASIQVS